MPNRRDFLGTVGLSIAPFGVNQRSDPQSEAWDIEFQNPAKTYTEHRISGYHSEYEFAEVDRGSVSVNGGTAPDFTFGAIIDGEGEVAANGAAVYQQDWEAPETGHYTAVLEYWGYGGLLSSPHWNNGVATTGTSEVNLAVIDEYDAVRASNTAVDIGVRNAEVASWAAEHLLETLAYRLIAPYLSLVGRIIAREVVDLAIDLDLTTGTGDDFMSDAIDPRRIEVEFTAREGEELTIQATPTVGFSSKSDERAMGAPEIESFYRLHSSFVRTRG